MEYIVLASGSKGNSTIINSGDFFIVIDVGITYKELESKARKFGYDLKDAAAILITHEHSDHIKSLEYFDNIQVYSGKGTCKLPNENELYPFIKRKIANFYVTPLPLSHDAVNCLGFLIETEKSKLVYINDTGYINYKLKPFIKNADYYLMESNHDVKMLLKSNRPSYLKSRILSDSGHLSNEMSSEELCELIGNNTKEIVFTHISEEVNTKDLVINTFISTAQKYNLDISNIKLIVSDQRVEVKGGLKNEKVISNI